MACAVAAAGCSYFEQELERGRLCTVHSNSSSSMGCGCGSRMPSIARGQQQRIANMGQAAGAAAASHFVTASNTQIRLQNHHQSALQQASLSQSFQSEGPSGPLSPTKNGSYSLDRNGKTAGALRRIRSLKFRTDNNRRQPLPNRPRSAFTSALRTDGPFRASLHNPLNHQRKCGSIVRAAPVGH